MAQREDLPYADSGHPSDESYAADDWVDDQYEDQYDDQYEGPYEGPYEDYYDDEYVHWDEPAPTPRRPWHRNPAVLIGLIAAASTALAVAAVLLVAGEEGEDSPTKLKPTIRTTAVVVPPSESPAESAAETSGESTSATTDTSSESAAAETEPADAESPAEGASPAAPEVSAPPPISARDGGSDDSEGPRINVTRSPMSFTPGG